MVPSPIVSFSESVSFLPSLPSSAFIKISRLVFPSIVTPSSSNLSLNSSGFLPTKFIVVLNTPDALASFSGIYSVFISPPPLSTISLAACSALNILIPPFVPKCFNAGEFATICIKSNVFPSDASSIISSTLLYFISTSKSSIPLSFGPANSSSTDSISNSLAPVSFPGIVYTPTPSSGLAYTLSP